MASDFAIGQFCFLERLLLVHGHWCYRRISMMVKPCFHVLVISSTTTRENTTFVFNFSLFFFLILFLNFCCEWKEERNNRDEAFKLHNFHFPSSEIICFLMQIVVREKWMFREHIYKSFSPLLTCAICSFMDADMLLLLQEHNIWVYIILV